MVFRLVSRQARKNTSEEIRKEIPKASEYIQKLKELGLKNHLKAYERVLEIAKAIKKAGGQALLVGGSVRDMLLGKISKDFDLEVYNLEPAKLEKLVRQFGKVSDVGRAFGVLKMSFGGEIEVDISLPRTDSKIGAGHRGFEVKADPHMSISEAARRRDFTINSMALNPLTGQLYDPFWGLRDLRECRLKVTDPERFKDDPLRIIRALQFIGRFGLSLDQESAKIIQEMIPCLKELPRERILEEWKKLLLKSEKPSLGLTAGMALGIFKEIHPEFPPLSKTPQERKWHPEGDVWIHTLMSVDEAANIVKRENLEQDQALVIMLTVFCHDLGKANVTEFKEGCLISHRHEGAGEEPTKKFLATIGVDNFTSHKVIKLVTNHLVPVMLYTSEVIRKEKVTDGTIRRLAQRIHPATIQELVLVAEADHLGRGSFVDPKIPAQLLLSYEFPAGPWLLNRAKVLEVEKSQPLDLILGREFLSLGFKPGPKIGKMIELANRLRDEKGYTKDLVFQLIDGLTSEDRAIKKFKEGLSKKTKNKIPKTKNKK